jgi:NADH-quinone oxidoreductase subunit J
MTVATLLFWIVVLVVASNAIVVVTARNILHAAFSLCLAFLGVAAIYVFLHADFVAAVQLIVYVGGILVLILFAIMFSANVVEDTAEGGRSKLALGAGALAALAVFAAVVLMTQRLAAPLEMANRYASAPYQAAVSVAAGQTGIGHCLMGQYLLPFEVVSVLLLAALVGAVLIIRKELK